MTGTVVLGDEGEHTYVSVLPNLDAKEVLLDQAHEFAGWAGLWVNDGHVLVSDGESPTLTRFAVAADGGFSQTGQVSFLNYGAQYADTGFVHAGKAYVFSDDAIVWDPNRMEVSDTFSLPRIADRAEGLEYQGARTGRGFAVRPGRAYVATSWANWNEYAVSEDSLVLVLDTVNDRVIDTISVPCPYLDVATVDDQGRVYFSNWTYSVGQTLLQGKKKACAVRLLADRDQLDPDWSLTFADVTDGREGAALRYLNDGKAVFSVFHQERVDLTAERDPAALADTANWRFWSLDLETLAAHPIENIEFNAGGYSAAQIDGRSFVMVPRADYASTSVYELFADGPAAPAWSVEGWATQLYKLR